MKILENLHRSFKIVNKDYYEPFEGNIKLELEKYTKLDIPEDFIDFLGEANGVVLDRSTADEFELYPVGEIIGYFEDEQRGGLLGSDDMLPIGDDMGCFTLFYGNGKEGFGIYQAFNTNMNYNGEFTFKLADSLIDLLVNGVGLDRLFSTKM